MVLARLWELFRLPSMVKRVEMTTCIGKTTVFMYIGVTNHVTLYILVAVKINCVLDVFSYVIILHS